MQWLPKFGLLQRLDEHSGLSLGRVSHPTDAVFDHDAVGEALGDGGQSPQLCLLFFYFVQLLERLTALIWQQ